MPVKTEFDELINYFFHNKESAHVYEGARGYNNSTRILERDAKKYSMRIYETHKDESKVRLEHEVLLKLNDIHDLPFRVPVPLTKDGSSFLRLPSNKIGCIFNYIEGENPVFDTKDVLFSYGESVGHLMDALGSVELEQPVIYRPYYEIEHTHPSCPISKVEAWCSNPPKPFITFKKELSWIATQLTDFKRGIPKIKTLPHQLIHGDLNESNVLGNGQQTIHAILDFEFATRDVRIMEVAVCISEILSKETNETVFLNKIHHFFSGLSTNTSLLDEEMVALPVLIQLRRLDVFVHFLGRYLDGVDDSSILEEQIMITAANPNWLATGANKMLRLWEYE
ncbi:phosphotransferase [Evansella tamaricis]|uniref:Phosphotransferase n=1 Tax=Evansella tamaricis TaxID=2069301 RepID=A0ABS6JDS4_9BACI|nr:phosphotransferase [Evansella tamaricis]MBU9711555.1 phosphotransferase [Evansella tamaricis]